MTIEQICEKHGIENYIINDDGSIDVNGDVYIQNSEFTEISLKLTELPLKFNKVRGDFDCSNNKLTTLKGCPKYVGGNFSCGNNNLTDLKGSPKVIDGSFYCSGNYLKSYVSDSIVGKTFYCQLIDDDFIVANYNEWNLNQKRKFKLNKILTN